MTPILVNCQIHHSAEIQDVQFLTPALVKSKVGDQEVVYMFAIDIVNRKVYDQKTYEELTQIEQQKIFDFLDNVNQLPDDFFAVSDEIAQIAETMQDEHRNINFNERTNIN